LCRLLGIKIKISSVFPRVIAYNVKMIKKSASDPYIAITGASSGIGAATAYKLAKNKNNLVLISRRKKNLSMVMKQCLLLGAEKVFILPLDVVTLSDPKNQKQVIALLKKEKIEVKDLINSAGLAKGTDLLQNSQSSDWNQMIDTNVKALLEVTKLFLPQIIKNQGHIVNLGSVAGKIVYEGGAVYCATKFAVRAITEGLRMDLKGTGVRVTNIAPGMVDTEFSLVRFGNQKKADAVYADMMPLSAEDIAENIFWCLNQPVHINIQELVIYPTDQAGVGQVVRGEKSISNLNKNKSK
jgi:3-hydroxy acid dehydrogenase/malonic semialdehyde reductase